MGEREEEEDLLATLGGSIGAKILSNLAILKTKVDESNSRMSERDKRLDKLESTLSDLVVSVESKNGLFVKVSQLETRIGRIEAINQDKEENQEEKEKQVKTFWVQLVVSLIGIMASAIVGMYVAEHQRNQGQPNRAHTKSEDISPK